MDRSSIARLTNASKNPFGRVGAILEQQYMEEQRVVRKKLADFLTSELARTPADWKAELPFMGTSSLEMIANARREQNPAEIVKLLAPPGRCAEPRCGGRCRGVPHRFATYVQCPLHHR